MVFTVVKVMEGLCTYLLSAVISDPVINYRLSVGKYISAAETREM